MRWCRCRRGATAGAGGADGVNDDGGLMQGFGNAGLCLRGYGFETLLLNISSEERSVRSRFALVRLRAI